MIKTYIIVAQTADGKIARHSNHEADWTSRADKKHFIEMTKKSGVMIMGLNTFKTFPSPLKDRLHIVYSDKEDAEKENIPGVVEYTKDSPSMLIQKLEERGFKEVAICGGSTIYTMFMKSGLVKNIYMTIEPRLFGEGMGVFNQELDIKMKLNSVRTVSDENVVLLEYEVLEN
jgi:dihydrofolate reductase